MTCWVEGTPKGTEVEMPLRLLFVGDYTSRPDERPLASRTPIRVDEESFQRVMKEQELTLSFTVADRLSGEEGGDLAVSLQIHSLSDMEPEGIALQVPRLEEALDRRVALTALTAPLGGEKVDRAHVDRLIAELDGGLSRQMDEILHHPLFQRLEAAWRGLKLVVSRVDVRENVRVDLLNCSKDDLLADFEESPGVLDSGLFEVLTRSRGSAPYEEPFAAILGNYEVGPFPADMVLLEKCAAVGAAVHAPFLAAAAPSFFDLPDCSSLSDLQDPKAMLLGRQYARFRAFRETEAARHAGLMLPRILLRAPFGEGSVPIRAFRYNEDTAGKHGAYCWGSAIHAFATRLAESFAKHRLCLNIVGAETGGRVLDLAVHPSEREGERPLQGPTEAAVSDELERALSNEGFLCLVRKGDPLSACFVSARSVAAAKQLDDTDEGRLAEASDRLGTELRWVFFLCRLAHHVELVYRLDRLGARPRAEIERELDEWMGQYVADGDIVSVPIRSRRPLRKCRIVVTEVEGAPPLHRFEMQVRTHFKNREPFSTLRISGRLESR